MLYSEKIQYFIEVVRQRSFSRAAKKLGVAPSTVTKTITAFEKSLGTILVNRLKSGVELTETGRHFYESIIESYLTIEQKFNAIQKSDAQHKKSIKIITTTGTTSIWLMPRLKAFQDQRPDVSVHIETTNDRISLSKTDADVALLPTIDDPGSVIKKKIYSVSMKLVASKDYVAEHGMPKSQSDLKNHKLIGYYLNKDTARGNVDWHLTPDGDYVEPSIIVNSAICLYQATLLGYGISTMGTDFPMEADLVEILPQETPSSVDIFFMTPKSRDQDKIIDDLYRCLLKDPTHKMQLSIKSIPPYNY